MRQIIDNFIDDFDWFRSYCDQLDFAGTVNPADGITYPGINREIPLGVSADIITKMQAAIGKRIAGVTMFLRMSLNGVEAPHGVHEDSVMAEYGMFLYLNRKKHCAGGTSFVKHIKTGMDSSPKNADQIKVWERDTNIPAAWEVTQLVGMHPNRAVLFETKDMHRSEPIEGFGQDNGDGRLVLICFARLYE